MTPGLPGTSVYEQKVMIALQVDGAEKRVVSRPRVVNGPGTVTVSAIDYRGTTCQKVVI